MNWVTTLGVSLAGLNACRLVMKTTNPIVRPNDPALKRIFRQLGYVRAFRRADLVLTLSEPEAAQLRAAFPDVADRFVAVANPYVTKAMLAPRPFAASAAGDGRLILGVGRFGPQKRMDLLLRAFSKLKTPDTRLVLLGDGPARGELERLAVSLGVASRVAFPGFVNNVADWFARADLFVLPSVYEGLPAVVIEAMAANCPVVATDCFTNARNLLGDAPGCALLANANPDRLATLIDAALAAPRPTGLRAVAARYSIDRAVADHLAAIDSLFPAVPVPNVALRAA